MEVCLPMLNVQNVHSTCWLYQLRTVLYFLSDNVTLIPPVFPFSLTETSHQESILPILLHFSDNMRYPCKCIS